MNDLIPETIHEVIKAARAERERLLTERLFEIERQRLAAEQELNEAFDAFYSCIETLIPEYLRPHVCLPQHFGEEKVPDTYHFNPENQHYLAFDIPGLSPFLAHRSEEMLEYIVPSVYWDDYSDPAVRYSWGYLTRQTTDPGEALLWAQETHDEYWERVENARRQAEERRRAQENAAEARKRLAEMIVNDPVLRLFALVVAQVQADREEFEQALEEARSDAEAAHSRAEKASWAAQSARREAAECAREAESLHWELERAEKALKGRW